MNDSICFNCRWWVADYPEKAKIAVDAGEGYTESGLCRYYPPNGHGHVPCCVASSFCSKFTNRQPVTMDELNGALTSLVFGVSGRKEK